MGVMNTRLPGEAYRSQALSSTVGSKIIMQFVLPQVPFIIPSSPNTDGTNMCGTVISWSMKSHDMMRPLVVV